MLSFIVPAFNEEQLLGGTLASLRAAASEVGEPYEIIVVDDASTDRTPQIAAAAGARVVRVEHRQIARTRNAGARTAAGEFFVFVDADTHVEPVVVAKTLAALRRGVVGGGAIPHLDGPLPLYVRLMLLFARVLAWVVPVTPGAYIFCTRAAFDAAGGFDERLFAGEDAMFGLALRRQGKIVLLHSGVVSSGRRVRLNSGMRIVSVLALGGLLGPRAYRTREGAARLWYALEREDPRAVPRGSRVWLSNLAALFVVALLLVLPIALLLAVLWWVLG